MLQAELRVALSFNTAWGLHWPPEQSLSRAAMEEEARHPHETLQTLSH